MADYDDYVMHRGDHRALIRHQQGFCRKDHDECPYCEEVDADA